MNVLTDRNGSSNLNSYLQLHVCLSFHRCVAGYVGHTLGFQSLSQNVTNKSSLVCVKSEKYAFWITLTPQLDRCCRGEAEVRILDFKTTWSEFHRPSRTATGQGKAELRIFDFKITRSEFQRPSQTATEQGKANRCIPNSKTTRRGNGMLMAVKV